MFLTVVEEPRRQSIQRESRCGDGKESSSEDKIKNSYDTSKEREKAWSSSTSKKHDG